MIFRNEPGRSQRKTRLAKLTSSYMKLPQLTLTKCLIG